MPDLRSYQHHSEVLEGNPMGDPHIRKLPVYLPPGYSAKRPKPYPVVFLLAGWSGRGAHYLADGGAFSWSIPERLDELIESKQLEPCIVLFPDGTSKLGCSQYMNSPVNGNYLDYICDELTAWADAEFHTHADRRYRGVIGHSSGGFGALLCGLKRSDRFAAICSSAGDSWYQRLYATDIPTVIKTLSKAGGIKAFTDEFLANPNPCALLGHASVLTMLILSMCSCYTPNPDVPIIKGDLWFDLETGALKTDAWNRLLAWDPVCMVEQHLTQLRQLDWIHLEAGHDDEYGLHLGHRQFAAKLKSHNIAHVVDEYPGKHGGHHYRMPERIRRMVAQMPKAS